MALPKDVQDAIQFIAVTRIFITSRERIKVPEGSDLFDESIAFIHAHLLSQDAELKILRVKCSGTLANNICPDHRDKQVGNPCLACTIEKLQSRLAAADALLREVYDHGENMALHEKIDAHLSENTHDNA